MCPRLYKDKLVYVSCDDTDTLKSTICINYLHLMMEIIEDELEHENAINAITFIKNADLCRCVSFSPVKHTLEELGQCNK